MIPLDDAREYVLAGCRLAEPTEVRLRDALGLVLAEEVVAAEAIPPFANTAVDGFAVRAADVSAAPVTLRVVGTMPAGAAPGAGAAAGVLASDRADAAGLTSAISSPSSRPSMAVRLSDWPTTFTSRGSNPSKVRR